MKDNADTVVDGTTPSRPGRAKIKGFDNVVSLHLMQKAIVCQIWLYNRDSRESHHILSQIDLVPDELPRIDCPPPWRAQLGKKSRWSAHCESAVIQSTQAVRWYDDFIQTGQWAPSWRAPRLTKPTPVGNVISEPKWPTLVLLEDARAIPFASRRQYATRQNHALAEHSLVSQIVTDKEHLRLLKLLLEKLGFDMATVPELWQSAHIFQPVPVLRHVNMGREFSEMDGHSLTIDLVPRKGASLEGLEIQIAEVRATGRRILGKFRPSSHFHQLSLVEDMEQIEVRVVHDDFGLLFEEGPFVFLRAIHTEMGISTKARRIELPGRAGLPPRTMRIPVIGSDQGMLLGESRDDGSAGRLLAIAKSRLKSDPQQKDKQQWFRRDAGAAERAIQQILSTARKRVLIVDPYFGLLGVERWLPAVSRRSAQIQVLTSSFGLRQQSVPDSDARERARELEHLRSMRMKLEGLYAAGNVNLTTIRIMAGEHAAIHDRFLLVDEKVWSVGSSLGEFGTRGTLLLKLPVPELVLPHLNQVWDNEAVPLEERIADLERSRTGVITFVAGTDSAAEKGSGE